MEAVLEKERYYASALLVYFRYLQQECTASSPTSQAILHPIGSFSLRQDVHYAFTPMLGAVLLGTIIYRSDRDPDLFGFGTDVERLYLLIIMSIPPFLMQVAMIMGMLFDHRLKPLVPHWVTCMTTLLLATGFPSIVAHWCIVGRSAGTAS